MLLHQPQSFIPGSISMFVIKLVFVNADTSFTGVKTTSVMNYYVPPKRPISFLFILFYSAQNNIVSQWCVSRYMKITNTTSFHKKHAHSLHGKCGDRI